MNLKKVPQLLFTVAGVFVIISPFIYHYRTEIKTTLETLTRPNQTSSLSWLTTSSNNIVTQEGSPILLRGVNISSNNWSPYYQKWHPIAVTTAAKDWKVNVIRTRIFQEDFETDPDEFFNSLESEILKPSRKAGVYVILHPWFKENASLPDQTTINMWQSVAHRYRNDPTIIYDLLAEPRDVSHQELKDAYKQLIPAVRKASPNSLIMVTGLDWGRDINYWLDDPLEYGNLVYRSNPYNRIGEFEGMFAKIALKYPVFLGEFGADESLTMDLEAVKSLLSLTQQLNIGWTAWNFSATGCPCLLLDESKFTPSEYGQIVKNSLTQNTILYDHPPLSLTSNPNRFDIYTDYLDNAFTDYSWGIDRALTSTTDTYSGINAIFTNFTPKGGIFLKTSRVIPVSDYSHFVFHLKTTNINPLILRFRNHLDQMSNPIPLLQVASSSPEWQIVTIPTNVIDLETISGITIEATPELITPQIILLDEIYFTR